jgi:hypothetical protein
MSFGLLVMNICNHGEHYETPCIIMSLNVRCVDTRYPSNRTAVVCQGHGWQAASIVFMEYGQGG